MSRGTWDQAGKRKILGILDQLVQGEIFSYDLGRPERHKGPSPGTPEMLR